MIKIIADKDIPYLENFLREFIDPNIFNITLHHHQDITNSLIKDCEILLVRSTTNVNELILKDTSVRFVASATAGINHLDTEYLESKNIQWGYAPGCNSSSVTHYVMAAIAIAIDKRKLSYNSRIGVIGYGHIGKKVAHNLYLLGFDVSIYDPYLNNEDLVDFESILECDLLTIHVPYTSKGKYPTHNLITKKELSKLEHKVLINSSRGGIVNEADVIDNKKIIYIADVWDNEPLPSTDIIKNAFIATPHIAGYSKQGKLNGSKAIAYKVVNYIKNKKHFHPFDFSEQHNRNNLGLKLNRNQDEAYPLQFFKKNLNLELITSELKILFRQNIEDKLLSKEFIIMRSNHPERNDFDS